MTISEFFYNIVNGFITLSELIKNTIPVITHPVMTPVIISTLVFMGTRFILKRIKRY